MLNHAVMNLIHKILILLFGVAICVQAVPPVLNYAGQVAVNGEAFDGNGLFKFALVNANGSTTYWSNDGTSVNGSQPQASVAVVVSGGLYSILLGNTAQQGMGAINPAVFAQHNDAELRVWFSDGVNGFQQLSPDRPFASVPYAFSAGTATIADGSINKAMLGNDVIADLNKTVTITRDMLTQDIRDDLNSTIGMNRLSSEVTEKLNQEKTTTNYNAPSVGSLLAVPYGSSAPAGYSLYQQGVPKDLVWEEMAPITRGRGIFDGIETLDGKIYLIGGGGTEEEKKFVERYSTSTNTWETISPLLEGRFAVASTVLDSKIYAIGGIGDSSALSSVEIFDPSTGEWTSGQPLPSGVNRSDAITVNNKIYLVGGWDAANQNTNQLLCFDPLTNAWTIKASMTHARHGAKVVWFRNRIWAIGGNNGSENLTKVESYDPISNTWREEASLNVARHLAVAWVSNGNIFVGGGWNPWLNSVEYYDSNSKMWKLTGTFPQNKAISGAVVSGNKIYIVSGESASGVKSKKVFAADLNASIEEVYDLYRKDGDAPVGTPVVQSEYADGSVTTSKLDATILKYLKPEITSQPQASTIYAGGDGTVSFSAEGKYLSYQWKKDGSDLTGETNATLTITDANATLHDGNYSVVVSNDFGSVESNKVEVQISDALLNGLVGWWKFDEGSGTVAYDSSGNGNDGNLINGPTWVSGKIGGALSFDGVNDHVRIGNVLNNMSSSCFSLWFKPASVPSGHGYMVFKQHTYALTFASNAGIHLNFGNGNEWGNLNLSTSTLDLNKWYNVTATRESGVMKVFIDINLLANKFYNTSSGSNSSLLVFGGNGTNSFNGLIDDVRIYDRALSPEEVQALYNMGQ